ncbi:glycosyltransferase involved in cell wall biosynthesis [Flavobacterium sp. W4I14]|nr:glycosyltransferase involved in cell wall biosynthesis [Flavobacterium sp. W4I14]
MPRNSLNGKQKAIYMLNKIRSWFTAAEKTITTDHDQLDPSKKTILVIDDDIPQYDKSSGSKRLFELIKIFREMNLNVIFLPNDGLSTEPYATKLAQLGVLVLQLSPDRKGMLKNLKGLLPRIDYAWVSRPMLNLEFQKILKSKKQIRIIFDTVDLHYVRMQRQAKNEGNEKLFRKALKFKKLELKLANHADATLTVTDTEKLLLEQEGIKNVYVIPNIHEIKPPSAKTFTERSGIIFIGGYKHEPNVDAVKWLIKDIMPLVWKSLGDITVYLLGSYPSAEVNALAGEKVFVPGFLEEVDQYFLNAKVFVAPLRYGAGMKGKIGQSLEFGLPIISTSIGVEGMDLIHKETALIADEASDFANQIIQLYQDEHLWKKIQENAVKSIEQYTPPVVSEKIQYLLDKLDLS